MTEVFEHLESVFFSLFSLSLSARSFSLNRDHVSVERYSFSTKLSCFSDSGVRFNSFVRLVKNPVSVQNLLSTQGSPRPASAPQSVVLRVLPHAQPQRVSVLRLPPLHVLQTCPSAYVAIEVLGYRAWNYFPEVLHY